MSAATRIRSLCLLAAATPLIGCGRLQSLRDCDELSSAVNPRLEKIGATNSDSSPRTASKLAAEYAQLAAQVDNLRSRNSELSSRTAEYSKLLHQASHDLAIFAPPQSDVAAVPAASKELLSRRLADLRNRERHVIFRINRICR